jgi:hypothetical protein
VPIIHFCYSAVYLLAQGKYRKWAKSIKFTSKLPSDVKKHKAAEQKDVRTLDVDLREKVPSAHVVPYSSMAFLQAAIEWLIATDQVCFLITLIS